MSATVRTALVAVTTVVFLCSRPASAQEQTLLLRDPSLSQTRIAFVYAGDIWTTDRDGGDPRRLTSDPADESLPAFSPDGSLIAYSLTRGGNQDVYVISAEGGAPTRLTWHPGADRVTGWSPDGRWVTFASPRETTTGRASHLWQIPATGGAPVKVMDTDYFTGKWKGDSLAYIPFSPAYNGLFGGSSGWKGYRGGRSPSVHVIDLERGRVAVVPGDRINDIEPMWDGETLYFVSDREDKALNIYRWDAASETAVRLTTETDWDIRAADALDGKIVYEAGGRLKELDLATGAVREIIVSLFADLPQARPQWKQADRNIETVHISPTGKRVLITARGDVFTVPVEFGSTRNLTTTDGRREYTALWSPKGDRIAYVVQEDGRQTLALVDQTGMGDVRTLELGTDFYQLLDWSGDGERLAYADNRLQLWVMDLEDGARRRIADQERRGNYDVDFSPDGRWLGYTLERPNFLSDLMLHDLQTGQDVRLSDGMADVSEVAFSPDGSYLFFAASTNSGPRQVGLDLSSQEQNVRSTFYAVVLAADGASPVAPRPGDEPAEDAGEDEEEESDEEAAVTRIDLDGIADRIVAVPVAERNYTELAVAADGDLVFVESVQPGASDTPPGEPEQARNRLLGYDFEEREVKTLAEGIVGFSLSADGRHIVARRATGGIVTAENCEKPEFEPLDTSEMRVFVDPRAEWRQIFEDAVRMQPAFFYAENMHGLDWAAVAERYRPLVAHVGRRDDLNDVIVEMIAELQVGHNRASGGDTWRDADELQPGLLGADLRVENGQWRIAKVLDGGSWNPFLEAPLAEPGLDVEAGDYLLAINGQSLTGEENVYRRLLGTVGVQTTLSVADDPDGLNRRDIVVEPIASEGEQRLWDWVESRHARVQEATDGRVGYVYLPNTTTAGYRFFNRMFFAQIDKPAMIVDERSNGGGQAANYVTDVLSRTYLSSWRDRDVMPFDTPGGAVYGPKVMLIDQYAGSGGDFLPYAFRLEGLGPLVGTRTWGGLIGISVNPSFVDGGRMVVPYFRFYTPEGEWRIENEGVAPDIEVAQNPLDINRGVDSQLEAAIQNVLERLEDYDPVRAEPPPLPTELGK